MNLELFIKLREMVSSGLVKMADTARKTTATIRGGNNTLAQSYDEIKKRIDGLETSIRKSTSISHIREARRELEQLQRMASKHPAGSSSRGGWLSGLVGQIMPAVSIAGALALGGGALTSGLQAQARQTSFEVMAGKEQGTQLNQNLTKFAQDSIYGNEVYQNAQTMMGFGITAKDVMPDLKMLGDVAMGDSDKLGRLTLAFSQVKAAGKLMGQDLLQFVNAGFNPLQTISEKTGKSIGELREIMSEGGITFDMVKSAFQGATSEGGRFYDMTNKIAQTDFGKWEAFKGQMAGLSMQIGGMLAPAFGNLISNFLSPFVQLMSDASKWIQSNWNWIGMLVSILGGAVLAYQSVIMVTKLWAMAQTLLNVAMTMNPIGLVVAGIAALVAGIIYAWKNFEGFRKVVWGLWESFKTVFTNIGAFFKKIFEPIFTAITAFKEGRYLDAAKAVGQMVYNVSPVGLAANAISFAKEGGFTKGVAEAWALGQEKGKNKDEASAISQAATPGGSSLNSAAFSSLTGGGDETAKGIAGGGPRVINIHGVKFAERIEVHNMTAQENANELQSIFEEMFLRVLNSGASVQ